jgi:molybdate transport system permease protein
VILAAIAVAFLVVPVIGLVQRAPWGELGEHMGAAGVRNALTLSLVTSLSAAALALLFGAPLAWLLARTEFPLKSLVRALALLPLVLPPVVGGVALLLAFGRNGIAGSVLDSFGVALPFTTAGAIVAELFVALPFAVLTVEAGVRGLDERLEDAASTLGAGRWYTLRRVTLPLLAPSLAAAAALCWARALGEFGATITFAGNLPGRTQTLPLAVYLELQQRPDVAILLSLVLLALSIAILVLLRGRWLSPRTT